MNRREVLAAAGVLLVGSWSVEAEDRVGAMMREVVDALQKRHPGVKIELEIASGDDSFAVHFTEQGRRVTCGGTLRHVSDWDAEKCARQISDGYERYLARRPTAQLASRSS